MRGNVANVQLASNNLIFDEMSINLDVLGASMENQIVS